MFTAVVQGLSPDGDGDDRTLFITGLFIRCAPSPSRWCESREGSSVGAEGGPRPGTWRGTVEGGGVAVGVWTDWGCAETEPGAVGGGEVAGESRPFVWRRPSVVRSSLAESFFTIVSPAACTMRCGRVRLRNRIAHSVRGHHFRLRCAPLGRRSAASALCPRGVEQNGLGLCQSAGRCGGRVDRSSKALNEGIREGAPCGSLREEPDCRPDTDRAAPFGRVPDHAGMSCC